MAGGGDEAIVYPYPRGQCLPILVVSGGVILVGLVGVVLGVRYTPELRQLLRRLPGIVIGLGSLLAVLGVGAALLSLWRMISPRPVMVLDREGMTTIFFGRVRWEEIERIHEHEEKMGRWRARYLAVVPRDVESVIARLNWFRRRLARMHQRSGTPPLFIPLWLVPVGIDELWLAIGRFFPLPARRE
jgi:hypothetical protein